MSTEIPAANTIYGCYPLFLRYEARELNAGLDAVIGPTKARVRGYSAGELLVGLAAQVAGEKLLGRWGLMPAARVQVLHRS